MPKVPRDILDVQTKTKTVKDDEQIDRLGDNMFDPWCTELFCELRRLLREGRADG
jgi:hypothetical protein